MIKNFGFIIAAIICLTAAGCGKTPAKVVMTPATNAPAKLTIGFMARGKSDAYSMAIKKGVEEAAKELDVQLLFDGSENPNAPKQIEIVDQWIARGVDAIVMDCENHEAASVVLRKAQRKGIHVLTCGSDCAPDARQFHVSPVTSRLIGSTLMDEAGRLTGEQGEFAIITGSLSDPTLNVWSKAIEERLIDKYPKMKLVAVRPCDDSRETAQSATVPLLNENPNLKLIIAVSLPGLPGVAEAVKQAGKTGVVNVIGLGTPSENRGYVTEGLTQTVFLWRPADLGYLAAQAACAVIKNSLATGDASFKAGRLGTIELKGDRIILGRPIQFNKDNIDQFDF